MLDRFDAMSILIDVVDKGSFSAVSRSRRIPLPTVSRKVALLEEHVGARLLTRSTRKLALTDAGEAYVTAARRILEQVSDAEARAAGEHNSPSGEIIVTAPVLFGRRYVMPIVTEFLATYPAIQARLLLSDSNAQFIDEHIDMAVRVGRLPDSSLMAMRVGEMRSVVCASPRLLAAHGTPITPDKLSNLPILSFDRLTPTRNWSFRSPAAGKILDVAIEPRLSVSNADAVVDAAIEGIGATRVLYYQCADAVRAGSLKVILRDFEPEPIPIHLIHPERQSLPFKTRAFLDFAADRIRSRLRPLAEDHPDEAVSDDP
jgi:DNA-binding transcriptional LysR family regulator